MRKINFESWSRDELLAYVLKKVNKQRHYGRLNTAMHIRRCKKLGISSHKLTHLDSKMILKDIELRKGRIL